MEKDAAASGMGGEQGVGGPGQGANEETQPLRGQGQHAAATPQPPVATWKTSRSPSSDGRGVLDL